MAAMDSEQHPPPAPGPVDGAPPAGQTVPSPPDQAPQIGGATQVSEAAVARVAAAAARSVEGVHSLGTGAGRALGALRGRVSGGTSESTVGVGAEVGREEVAVDLTLVAEYGRPLHAIADDVRAAVFRSVEELTGLRVIEVNVEIGDVHVAVDSAPGPAPGALPTTSRPAESTTPDGERA
ncbi:Asp23/Gls24 family envelope stress response protein [Zhihengliuella halotolerans]|uniref:Asp23/Gls24 family envelope stress response protein n=1 Tax=Zhihengliuella halotolerans TaxID=370736 RepID=UPI002155CCA5|nr:Asp23/Gls24 family envelope stress response protein [Zhihengliuella halotolerans]